MTRWTQDQLDEYQTHMLSFKGNLDKNNPYPPDDGPESKLQGKAEKWFKAAGYPCFHDRSRGKNKAGSILDLYGYLPKGRHVIFEFKDKKGKMSPEQLMTYKMLKFLGHEVYEVRSYRQFLSIVNQRG